MAAQPGRKGEIVSPFPEPVYFLDPDGQLNFARYQLGRWRGTNRYRGYTLEHRRSRNPYLQAANVRIPVRIVPASIADPTDLHVTEPF